MKRIIYLTGIFLSLLSQMIFASETNNDFIRNWQITFQEAVTPVMEKIHNLHDLLLYVVYGISGLVFVLLLYICLKFNRKSNPNPSKTSHNVFLEVIWTAIPVIIVIAIAIPSVKTIYYIDKAVDADMTVKVIGHQWYWEYEYPDHGDFKFDSYIIQDKDLKPGQFRLLEVDNRLVVPVDTKIKVLITSADVVHSWAVPAFGLKTDAIPGRTNETWMKITKPGVYYGQCSQLCGFGHGFMPIAVEVLSKEEFAKWVEQAKKTYS